MTIKEVLTTKSRRTKAIVKNNGVRMQYPQIQFTSDCIRRYALNRGKRLDEALAEIQRAGGMDIIASLYAENPNLSPGVVARKLERKMLKQ